MEFSKPTESAGDQFNAKDHEGKLVLFLGQRKDVYQGDWGPTDIAACSLIIILDGDDGPRVFEDAWVFGAALAPTVYKAKGPLLGRLAKGEGKKGQNAPWILLDGTKTDEKAAASWAKKYIELNAIGEYVFSDGSDPSEAPF